MSEIGLDNSLSFAKENSFALTINRFNGINLNCNRVSIPGISVTEIVQSTPSLDINTPSNKIAYEPFSFSFLVDEDYKNYVQVFNLFLEYQINDEDRFDFSVIIPNNHGRAGISVNFISSYFLSIDSLDLTAETTKANEIPCNCVIRFNTMNIQEN